MPHELDTTFWCFRTKIHHPFLRPFSCVWHVVGMFPRFRKELDDTFTALFSYWAADMEVLERDGLGCTWTLVIVASSGIWGTLAFIGSCPQLVFGQHNDLIGTFQIAGSNRWWPLPNILVRSGEHYVFFFWLFCSRLAVPMIFVVHCGEVCRRWIAHTSQTRQDLSNFGELGGSSAGYDWKHFLHLGPYTSTWKQRKFHLSLAFPTGELQEQVELITPRIAAKLGETTKVKRWRFSRFFWYNMDRALLKIIKSIAAYVRNAYLYRCI